MAFAKLVTQFSVLIYACLKEPAQKVIAYIMSIFRLRNMAKVEEEEGISPPHQILEYSGVYYIHYQENQVS